jgi:hypothetical protein
MCVAMQPGQPIGPLTAGLVMVNVGHWASSSPGHSSVNLITLDLHCTLGNAATQAGGVLLHLSGFDLDSSCFW